MKATVKFAANFESNLVSIDEFWRDRNASQAFLELLEDLEGVIGNLERYPRLGRPFLARLPQSLETGDRISRLKHRFGDVDLREYLFDDYVILYSVSCATAAVKNPPTVYLLAIRHYRQLSFDFENLWRSNPES